LPVQVDRHDLAGLLAERSGEGLGAHRPCFGLDVAENGCRTRALDRRNRRHAGVRLRDDLISRPDPGRSASSIASVLDATPTAYAAPHAPANSCSKASPQGRARTTRFQDAGDRVVELGPVLRNAATHVVEPNHRSRLHGRRVYGLRARAPPHAELLLEHGYDVSGLTPRSVSSYPNLTEIKDRIEVVRADVNDQLALVRALRAFRPHEVYNLASVSFVPMSWEEPVLTAELAAVGATSLLEASFEELVTLLVDAELERLGRARQREESSQ